MKVPYAKAISLEPNRPVHVATVEAQIGDVVVDLEVLRSRDGSLRVGWSDFLEMPPDVRAEVEADVLLHYEGEESAERLQEHYAKAEGRGSTE